MRIKRTGLLDRRVHVRDSKLYVIATEGEKTEKQYFSLFQSPRVKVEVLATGPEGLASSGHVLRRLAEFQAQYQLNPDDELWLMVDVDRIRPQFLSDVCREATQKGFGLAVSNPCFELWLWLHFADAEAADTECKAVEARLRNRLGAYSKTNLPLDLFTPEAMREAALRARALHRDSEERWPALPAMHVYQVVESLLVRTGE